MLRVTNRMLCVVATAITLLCLVTATEARDKKKCYTYACQPCPQQCRPEAFVWHCATEFLFESGMPDEPTSYVYKSGACNNNCTEGPTITLGSAPPIPDTCPNLCGPHGAYCLELDIPDRMTNARKDSPKNHKGIPVNAFVKLDDAKKFGVNKNKYDNYNVKVVKESIVQFEVLDHNNQKRNIVAVLKEFEVRKKVGNALVANVKLGIELNPEKYKEPIVLGEANVVNTSSHSLALMDGSESWTVVTQMILLPPE